MSDYSDFVQQLLAEECDSHCGGRKIFYNKTLEVRDFQQMDLDLFLWGYRGHKMKSLLRHYWNEQATATAKKEMDVKFTSRKDYSVGFHMYGIPKTRGQAGYCMQAMTIVKEPSKGRVRLNVFYRTVEIVKKFYADLVFIRDVVEPFFGLKFDYITFYFSSLTLNTLYTPMMVNLIDDPVPFFEWLEENDLSFYRIMCRVASVSLDPTPNNFAQLERGKLAIHDGNREILKFLADQWPRIKTGRGRTRLCKQ